MLLTNSLDCFEPGKPFHPSLTFDVKARRVPLVFNLGPLVMDSLGLINDKPGKNSLIAHCKSFVFVFKLNFVYFLNLNSVKLQKG
jgi:hypothetical protein